MNAPAKIAYYRELEQSDIERMLLPRRFWQCTYAEIYAGNDVKLSPKGFVRRYLDSFSDNIAGGVGLILWGNNGRGKTAIAAVIAKWARRFGHLVMFVEAAELKRCTIEKVRFDEESTIWERALSVDVLILDDLGKGVQDRTGFGARLMDELIRHRSANRRVTIMTTNLNPQDLRAELKHSTAETLKECAIPFFVDGPDRRMATMRGLEEQFQLSV